MCADTLNLQPTLKDICNQTKRGRLFAQEGAFLDKQSVIVNNACLQVLRVRDKWHASNSVYKKLSRTSRWKRGENYRYARIVTDACVSVRREVTKSRIVDHGGGGGCVVGAWWVRGGYVVGAWWVRGGCVVGACWIVVVGGCDPAAWMVLCSLIEWVVSGGRPDRVVDNFIQFLSAARLASLSGGGEAPFPGSAHRHSATAPAIEALHVKHARPPDCARARLRPIAPDCGLVPFI